MDGYSGTCWVTKCWNILKRLNEEIQLEPCNRNKSSQWHHGFTDRRPMKSRLRRQSGLTFIEPYTDVSQFTCRWRWLTLRLSQSESQSMSTQTALLLIRLTRLIIISQVTYLLTPENFYIFKGRKFKNFKGQTEQTVQSHLIESNTNKIYTN